MALIVGTNCLYNHDPRCFGKQRCGSLFSLCECAPIKVIPVSSRLEHCSAKAKEFARALLNDEHFFLSPALYGRFRRFRQPSDFGIQPNQALHTYQCRDFADYGGRRQGYAFASSALLATHTTYDYLGRIEGQALAAHAEKLQISSTSEFAVTVEGELDQEELADINKLLDAIETTVAGVFSGKSDKLLKSIAELGDLDSIASFDAALSYSREASAERATRSVGASEAPDDDATETAPTNRLSKPRSTRPFLNKLVQVARHLEDEKSLDKLPKRFMQLFKKLAHNLALDEHEQRLTDRLAAEDSKRRSGLEHPSATRRQ